MAYPEPCRELKRRPHPCMVGIWVLIAAHFLLARKNEEENKSERENAIVLPKRENEGDPEGQLK